MSFIKITAKEIEKNVFKMTDDDWMLVTGGDISGFNTMTASWGAFGTLWGKSITECYLRPQRYTLEFMEKCNYYTISFYDKKYRPQLSLCGTKSGRDIDKVKETGFTPAFADCGAVYFEEANLVIVCKKIYTTNFVPEGMDASILENKYSENDFHRVYIGEIIEVLKKEG